MKIGLAFEGGGGKGAYQIGVWKALREIKLDKHIAAVSGTSIGAMNAFLFAYGNYDLAETIWKHLSPSQVFSNPEKNIILWDNESGFFSRQGVKGIIEQLDLCRVNKNSKPCYATCLKVADGNIMRRIIDFYNKLISGDIIINSVANPLNGASLFNFLDPGTLLHLLGVGFGFGDVEYFKINNFEENIKEEILLASSAIPVVFPEQQIYGSYYIDGGLIDNLPIKPLFENEGCDKVILIHCNHDSKLSRNLSDDVMEIIPQTSQSGLLGTFDFTEDGIAERIKQGYRESIKKLQDIDDLIY